MRKYSNMYPEYLLKELEKSDSQFYEVIEESFVGLAHASNQEAI